MAKTFDNTFLQATNFVSKCCHNKTNAGGVLHRKTPDFVNDFMWNLSIYNLMSIFSQYGQVFFLSISSLYKLLIDIFNICLY